MITADRLQTSLWDMILDGMRIALVSFTGSDSTDIEAGNQTVSPTTLPTITNSDILHIANTGDMILTADDFQIDFFGTRARNVMTIPEVCSSLIS